VVGNISVNSNLTETEALQLASAMARHSLHPVSRALLEAANNVEPSKTMRVSAVQEVSGAGLTADSVWGNIKLGSAKFCGLIDSEITHTDGSMVHLVSDNGWLASFAIVESIKPSAASCVRHVTEHGLQVAVLSGDKLAAVQRVANAVGIKDVFGDCSPQDKLTHIQALQQQGKKILMVGDGLNDGPVLASAHVSIAMGQAVPLAQAQSDFVVMNGDLAMVPYLMTQAKRTMRIVKQNLTWAAIYNATCVPLAIAGLLPAWLAGLGMALSSLLVILNAARLANIDILKAE
jgi:Cu2+-exporting ATPase